MNRGHLPQSWINSFQSVAVGNDLVEPDSFIQFSISCRNYGHRVIYSIERLHGFPTSLSLPSDANRLFEEIHKKIYYTKGHECPFLLDTGKNFDLRKDSEYVRCSVGMWKNKLISMHMALCQKEFGELLVECFTNASDDQMIFGMKNARSYFEAVYDSFGRNAIVVECKAQWKDCPVRGAEVGFNNILDTLQSSLIALRAVQGAKVDSDDRLSTLESSLTALRVAMESSLTALRAVQAAKVDSDDSLSTLESSLTALRAVQAAKVDSDDSLRTLESSLTALRAVPPTNCAMCAHCDKKIMF
jgi:hypothetical protein